MKLVTVIPLKKGGSRGDLTYFTTKEVSTGNIVSIPLRNKNILGLVVGVEDAQSAKSDVKDMNFSLRKITEVKEYSIFRTEYLEAVFDVANYFATTKDTAITSLMPAILREDYDTVAKSYKKENHASHNIETDAPKIKTEKLLFQASPEDRISSYKTLIRESFAQKKSIYIVLPTERDIQKLYDILSKGVEQFTFTIHGALGRKKTLEKIKDIMTTEHGVLILGTAPFLSIPRNDIGIVIIEHESSTSYKMIPRPHMDLRVFVELFAAKIGARLIMSDTLLRFETIARVDTDGLSPLYPISYRINFGGDVLVENPRPIPEDRETKTAFKIFSDNSLQEIYDTINKKKNVFIFSLRKGLATMTVCRDCGEMVACDRCSAPLVLYLLNGGQKRMFACNRCQREIDGDISCKNCGGWNLMPLGIGTDTVIEELKDSFQGGRKIKIFKLDKETAKTRKGAEIIIKEFESSEGAILVGTEMALFYLNKPTPLSVIASFDALWSIPNFKMSEKILDLMISIMRNTTNKFIIQTKNDTDGAILGIKNNNLLSFIRDEIKDRKNLGYPPFVRFIKITHFGNKDEALKAREALKELFSEYEPEIFSGFVAKQKGKYATNALIKINPKKWSLPQLSINSKIDEMLLTRMLSLPRNFDVFVDPEDLL